MKDITAIVQYRESKLDVRDGFLDVATKFKAASLVTMWFTQ